MLAEHGIPRLLARVVFGKGLLSCAVRFWPPGPVQQKNRAGFTLPGQLFSASSGELNL
jgi:hypothetical protein